MKEKLWQFYDKVNEAAWCFKSDIKNRLIRHLLHNIWLDRSTMRMMIHTMGKGNARACLEEYDEIHKSLQLFN